MFDIHSIALRKNPYGAIAAFKAAFTANDTGATLVLKINNSNADIVEELTALIGDYHNIVLITRALNREEIDNLISLTDCYLSLHHSEGFGLGPAEAMALGKVAIATGWSGNMQYMTPENSVPVAYELVALGKDYGPYEAHQIWARPDIEHAAREMKALAEDPVRAREIGERARRDIALHFSAAAIGAVMKERLSLQAMQSIQRDSGVIKVTRPAEGTLRARAFSQIYAVLFSIRFIFRPFFPPLLRHRVRQFLLRLSQKRNS